MSLREKLLATAAASAKQDPAKFAEEFQQEVVNKRLRWEESVVDATQPSLARTAKAIIAATKDDSTRDAAVRELVRFELGPLASCSTVIETCVRETEIYTQQMARAKTEREAALKEVARLRQDIESAKSLSKTEIEKWAKECERLASKKLIEGALIPHRDELARVNGEIEKVNAVLHARKQRFAVANAENDGGVKSE